MISDSGLEVYRLLRQRTIHLLLVMGVHTNFCVLGRSFGIRQMRRWGVPCVLVRDLTDALYNPAKPPFVSHAEGTELVIRHIEQYWCPTIVSDDLAEPKRDAALDVPVAAATSVVHDEVGGSVMSTGANDLAGQVVIVVGASSGMGRATAVAAAEAGAHVVLAARNADALKQLGTTIHDTGGEAVAIVTDATDRDAAGRLIDGAIRSYGRIDILVNSVGANIARRALDELTAESWAAMLATNLTAAFNLTQAVVPVFREQQGGLLIHISSVAAKKPDRSGVAYQATKAGVVGLAHGTMEEARDHGVRTTVIFPGLTDTPLLLHRPAPVPPEVLARALQPEDVAAACLFVMRMPPRAHIPELVLLPSRG